MFFWLAAEQVRNLLLVTVAVAVAATLLSKLFICLQTQLSQLVQVERQLLDLGRQADWVQLLQ
jgi:hypothetical protein